MNISEIRNKYPQYQDLSDQQLADGLYKRYYSDMDFNDFAGKIGFSVQEESTPVPEEPQQVEPQETKPIEEFNAGDDTGTSGEETALPAEQQKYNTPSVFDTAIQTVKDALYGELPEGIGALQKPIGTAVDYWSDKLMTPEEEKELAAKNPNLMAARYALSSLLPAGNKLASPEDREAFSKMSPEEQRLEIIGETAGWVAAPAIGKAMDIGANALVRRFPFLGKPLELPNWFRRITNRERGLVLQSADDMKKAGMSDGEILRNLRKSGNTAEFERYKAEAIKARSNGETAEDVIRQEPVRDEPVIEDEPVGQPRQAENLPEVKEMEEPNAGTLPPTGEATNTDGLERSGRGEGSEVLLQRQPEAGGEAVGDLVEAVAPEAVVPSATEKANERTAGKAKEPWEMTLSDYLESERQKISAKYPMAKKESIDSLVKSREQKWHKSLEDRAKEGRIPDDVLDDYVDRYGEGALRAFRGQSQKGVEGWLPKDVREQELPPDRERTPLDKQRWERTWDEQRKLEFAGVTYKVPPKEYREAKKRHKAEVQKAIWDGKQPPPEVLADYPDLAKPVSPTEPVVQTGKPEQPTSGRKPIEAAPQGQPGETAGTQKPEQLTIGKKKAPLKLKKEKRKTGPVTIGGAIKKMGGINFKKSNLRGESKNMPVWARLLGRKNGQTLDVVEQWLRDEKGIRSDESLYDILMDPQGGKRRLLDIAEEDYGQAKGTESDQRAEKEMKWEPEEPPQGEYIKVYARDLPEGKAITVIEGKSEHGWDVYRVEEKDPFGVKLVDGTTLELAQGDMVEVLSDDVKKDEPRQTINENGDYVQWDKTKDIERAGLKAKYYATYDKDGKFKKWMNKAEVDREVENIGSGQELLTLKQDSFVNKKPTAVKAKQDTLGFGGINSDQKELFPVETANKPTAKKPLTVEKSEEPKSKRGTQSKQGKNNEPSNSSASGYADVGGYATNVKSAMNLPEIVYLAKKLMNGKYPSVATKLRKSGAVGVFYPSGDGTIKLKADLFKNPEQAAATLAHEIGHLVDYLQDKDMKRGNILGRVASLKNYMKHTLPNAPDGPGELTSDDRKRLRKEAEQLVKKGGGEEWIDEVIRQETPVKPDDILAIWNAIEGADLIDNGLIDYVKGLNTAQKKAVVKAALRGVVPDELKQFAKVVEVKTGKKIKIELTKEQLRDKIKMKYAEMINAELEKRKLFDLDLMTRELKDLTLTWKPFDPNQNAKYTKYRFSSPELYADAISALINAPGLLKAKAPSFYEAFFNYLERKPEVKRLYEKIQEDIRGGGIEAQRTQRVYDMFKNGDEAYALSVKKEGRFKEGVMRELVDAHWSLIKKIREVGEGNIPAEKNPRYKLEDLAYSGAEAEWYLKRVLRNIIEPLEKESISWDDFGAQLYFRRVSGERSEMANPQGWTPEIAQKKLDDLRANRTDAQNEAMDNAIESFNKLRKYVIDKGEKAGRWDDELLGLMRDTDTYATFDVIKYIEKRGGSAPSSKIYKQVGTLNEIANPATSTVLKDIAMIKAINRQEAAEATVKFLQEYFPNEVEPAKRVWNGRFKAIKEPDQGKGLIAYLKNGKAEGYYVDPWIAKSFDSNPWETRFLGIALNALATPFRTVFTEINPGFWAFNIYRDYIRAAKNLEGASLLSFAKFYLSGIKPAFRSVFGIPDDVVEKMLKGDMLISIADYRSESPEDKEIERLLRRFHLKERSWRNNVLKPFGVMFTWWSNVGKGIERTTKVGAYKYLTERYPDMPREVVAHLVRNAGSPDFLRGGLLNPIYNNVMLFSNAIKEGYRGDYEAFSKNKSGYTYKTFKYNILPKLLMKAAAIGLLGSGIKAIFDGVSEYDKCNYTIIPLGLTESGKSVYLRVPVDENGRFVGGVMWKLMDGETNNWMTGLVDYMAGQAPTLNPGISMLIDSIDYASGKNPYDSFRGRYAINEQVHEAGGKESHIAFLKWLANQSGAGIVYRFKNDDIDRIKGELETVIGYPFIGNIVGRFIRVSDRGLHEKNRRDIDEIRQLNTRELLSARSALSKLLSGEKINKEEATALLSKPDVVNDNAVKFFAKKYGNIYMQDYFSASSNAEKAAVLKNFLERLKLLKESDVGSTENNKGE